MSSGNTSSWMTVAELLSHQIILSQLVTHSKVPSIALTLDKQTSQWLESEYSSLNMSTPTCPTLAVLLFNTSTCTLVAMPQRPLLGLQPQQCHWHSAMGWCRAVPVHVGLKALRSPENNFNYPFLEYRRTGWNTCKWSSLFT